MTISPTPSLVERVRARLAEIEAEIGDHEADLAGIAEGRSAASEAQVQRAATRLRELRAERDDLRERADELDDTERRQSRAASVRQAGNISVRHEPRTYDEHARDRSFFADAYAAQFRGDQLAAERLARHAREMQTEIEGRALTTGSFNGLIPPIYLLDRVAEYARAMRPFANAVPGYALPADGMDVVITRVTTGTGTAVQTAQNDAATEVALVTTDVSVPVITIMGKQDISRQTLERGRMADELIVRDIVADFATKLDQQTLRGSGSDGQSLGILNVSGIATQTWTGTTVASFMSKLGGALNEVATKRFAPADTIVMHPRRWHWLLAQSDQDGRPLVTPYPSNGHNVQGVGGTAAVGAAGDLMGLPVIVDSNVPVNLGASTNEDVVIVTRMSDHVLHESPVQAVVFEAATNAPASVRIGCWGYAAFSAERYPTATAVITGTGLVPPTFS